MAAAPDPLRPLQQRVARYYGEKVLRHGPTPLGVDWSCELTQQLRFVQLLRVCDFSSACSLNDVGCGYGALLRLLAQRHRSARVDYLGIDLAPEMVEAARTLWSRRPRTAFHVGADIPRRADYSVASGLFNVRIDEPVASWEAFIADTLRSMARASTRGFAANFLAPLPEGMEGKPELYRAAAAPWMDYCRRELGGAVTLLDTYGMREFTLLVRG